MNKHLKEQNLFVGIYTHLYYGQPCSLEASIKIFVQCFTLDWDICGDV